ncbi:acetyl-CoA C-acetyltransferase [Desulfatiferula olefinivorans]
MNDVVIVSGARTAIGAFGGCLKSVSAIDLGALVIQNALLKAGLRPVVSDKTASYAPEKLKTAEPPAIDAPSKAWDKALTPVAVDEVIMGNVLTAGLGQNPGRQAMIRAGVPKETPGFTINKVCGSGLKSIALAASAIMNGQAEVVIAGGQESMSNAPMALQKARWGHRMELTGVGEIHDLVVYDGLYEIFNGYHMGITAENIASLYSISRLDQDRLAYLSHQRALAAIRQGMFKDEIVPVVIPGRKGDTIVDTDERPMETTMEKMGAMKPAFRKDGTVTAGNASGINDGAAAVVMMSASKARELGLEPCVTVKGFAVGGVDPAYMGLGPVPAVKKVLHDTKMSITDIDMIELNEAFAAQAMGCMLELGIDFDRPNQLGSGISLGHPIGCTGARQMVTLIHEMKRKNSKTGLVSMCIGGGMGMAMIVER